jgi:Polyketide cyclase / dehydrase and lipid transport
MATVEASIEVPAALADVWDLYFEADRWPSWVDQFGSIVSSAGYPEVGGELIWSSTGAGRGRVRERVVAHEPRNLHRIEYSDPESAGSLETSFAMVPAGDGRLTRVSQRLAYALEGGGPLAAVTDYLFIRTQMRRSLERSLSALRAEAAEGD